MKRIGVSYVYWYNVKYERYGHLFQDRYKSERVENDKYLMVVLRYIHQNPLKAGIVEEVHNYKWSSYGDYIKNKSNLLNTKFIFDILSHDHNKAVNIFDGDTVTGDGSTDTKLGRKEGESWIEPKCIEEEEER